MPHRSRPKLPPKHAFPPDLVASASAQRLSNAMRLTGHLGAMRSPPSNYGRAPAVAARLLALLQQPNIPALRALTHATAHLRATGFDPPPWQDIMTGVHPEHAAPEPGDPIRGWQRHASQPADERAAEMLFTTLTPASQALLHS